MKNHWDRILQVVKGQQFYPVLHAFYAGIIGAQSVMFAKAALLFFSNACKGVEVGKSAGLFVAFLFPMGICLWNQIYYLNMALRIYPDAVFVLPVYQVSWIAGGACSGLVFYQEYVLMSWTQLSLFWMGIIVSGVGLIILANREHMERRGCVVGADDPPAPSAGESLLSPFSPPPEDRRASQASRRDSRPAALRRLSRERAASTSTNGLSNGPTSSSVTAGDPAAHDTEPPSRKPSADSAAPYGAVQRDRASRMSANLDAVEGVMALRGDPVFSEHSPTGADWAGAPGMAFEHEHSPSAITWTTNAVE